jgi:hypothetical protein
MRNYTKSLGRLIELGRQILAALPADQQIVSIREIQWSNYYDDMANRGPDTAVIYMGDSKMVIRDNPPVREVAELHNQLRNTTATALTKISRSHFGCETEYTSCELHIRNNVVTARVRDSICGWPQDKPSRFTIGDDLSITPQTEPVEA